MKKVTFITIMLMAAMAVSAQGRWFSQEMKGDELKGTLDATVYNYIVDGIGSFVFWGYNVPQYALYSPLAPFNTFVSGQYIGMIVHVGIYDDNDNLLDKFDMWLDKDRGQSGMIRTRNASRMFTPARQEKNMKKIFTAMKSGKGYIRIVAERYDSPDFDIKVPPYNESAQ